ncbi:MAG: hypothetical protein JNK74_29240, partial [Candidatus Hydrogenedentes bacterium]|nr:hypothetical protein [Candidatus Hydrogenedentota bacterium]
MPEKNYMVVHARPDHSFRIPRPDLSQELGTPNACNQCHADKKPAWAAEAIARWYGPERRQEPGFAATLAAARAGRREALPGLLALLRDPPPHEDADTAWQESCETLPVGQVVDLHGG